MTWKVSNNSVLVVLISHKAILLTHESGYSHPLPWLLLEFGTTQYSQNFQLAKTVIRHQYSQQLSKTDQVDIVGISQ